MHPRLRRPAVVVSVSALAAAVLGVAPAQAATGSISGHVSSHGVAVTADVIVSAYQVEDGDWSLVDEAATDGAGDYTLDVPGAGNYAVSFDSPGATYAWEYYDDTTDWSQAETVVVGADQHVTGIDADLALGAHITGSITDEAGTPLEDAWVNVLALLPGEGDWDYVAYGIPTDAQGDYDLAGLQPGAYVVELNASGYRAEYFDDAATFDDATEVVVAEGASAFGIDARLSLGATISGTVTDAAGRPLAAVEVYADSVSGRSYGYASTAADGTYTIGGLDDGSFVVGFDFWNQTTDDYLFEYYDNVGSSREATRVATATGSGATGIDARLVAGEHDPPAMTNLSRPTITGVPLVGSPLTAWTGSWSPVPVYAEFHWFREGVMIDQPPSRTYVPTAADVGKRLSVLVVVGAPGHQESWAFSADTAPVVAAQTSSPPVVVVPPPVDIPAALASVMADLDVKGKPRVGSTVRVTHLDGQLRTPVSYAFRWYAGGKAIKKATKSRLKVTRAMAGTKLTVKVTARAGSTTRRIFLTVGKVR